MNTIGAVELLGRDLFQLPNIVKDYLYFPLYCIAFYILYIFIARTFAP